MQRVLALSKGTFASTKDLSFLGKAFNLYLIIYLAPTLYDADKSTLYILPVVNLAIEYGVASDIS